MKTLYDGIRCQRPTGRQPAGGRDYHDGENGEGNTLRLISEAIARTGGFYAKTITRDYEGTGTGQLPGRDAGFHIGAEYAVAYHYDNAGTGSQLTGTGRFKRVLPVSVRSVRFFRRGQQPRVAARVSR